jgi:hypothetical protein
MYQQDQKTKRKTLNRKLEKNQSRQNPDQNRTAMNKLGPRS